MGGREEREELGGRNQVCGGKKVPVQDPEPFPLGQR